jgi:hypothetical protein
MESRTTTLDMLDEVCRDMKLEWPGGNRDRRGRSRYASPVADQLAETSLRITGD